MRSLFAQLWLAFLAVTAATFAASLAFSYAAAVKRSSEANSLSPSALAASAQQALTAGGTDGLDAWSVAEVHRQPEISVYFVDADGREILGRAVHGQALGATTGRASPVVRAPDGTAYTVLVRRVRGVVFDFWRMLLRPWVLGALVLTVSGLGCALLAWLLSRPVRQLRSAVRDVAAGRLDVKIAPDLATRSDELGGLARDFQQMAQDLRKLISSKEELLRDVSHELRSPLARLRVAADLARNDAADRTRAFQRIDREVERIDAMIAQILHFSRVTSREVLATEQLDAGNLLRQAVEDVKIEANARTVAIRVHSEQPATVAANRSKLLTAIDNVLRNAIYHAPPGSTVHVQSRVEQDCVRIVVSDRGPGIATADRPHVFEPFYRGSSSNGAGLGLAITRNVMEQHGGSAHAENRPGGGFEVELSLPRPASGTARGR